MATKHIYSTFACVIVTSLQAFGVTNQLGSNAWAGVTIERAWEAVKSWKIEYESLPFPSDAGFSPVHKVMAVAAPRDLYLLNAHFAPTIPWTIDPFCQEIFAHEGMENRSLPFNRSYEESQLKTGYELPKAFWQDVLLAVVPQWPITDYVLPLNKAGTRINFVDAIRSGDYQLLPDHQIVSGEECMVYDYKGIDRIWLAVNKGDCVMRRDLKNPNSSRLVERIVTEKEFQVGPGLWLPEIFEDQYRFGTNDALVLQKATVHILHCLINNGVTSSTFTPLYPPGCIKFEVDHFTQVVPGGEDLLDTIVMFCVKYVHLPSKAMFHASPLICLLSGFVTGIAFGFISIPRKERTAQKGTQACKHNPIYVS